MAISRAYARSWSLLRKAIAQQAISQESVEGGGRDGTVGVCGLPRGIPMCVSPKDSQQWLTPM